MRMRLFMLGAFLLLVTLGITFALLYRYHNESPQLSSLLNCFPTASTTSPLYRPEEECLKESVASLLETHTTKDLMNYIVATTTPFTVTRYCHEVAHVIGEETFIKSGDLKTALSECSRQCEVGCIHGVIAADVAKELGGKYLTEDIAHANPAEVEELGAKYCAASGALCHAMGHVLYIGAQSIKTALGGCEKISTGSTTEACSDGVFMEASGAPAAFVQSASTTRSEFTDYAYPCDSVGAKYQFECFLYLPDFQRQLAKNGVAATARFGIVRTACESFTNEKARSDCFFSVGFKFIRGVDQNDTFSPASAARCDSLSGIEQNSCVVGLSLQYALFHTFPLALNYCSGRSDEKSKTLCYRAVFQTMTNYSFKDADVLMRCDIANAADECRKQYAAYLPVARTLPQYETSGLFGSADTSQ
jgi:hypothetical protein